MNPIQFDNMIQRILSIKISHPLRVAIDGVDCAGKTTFADALAERMRSYDREILRASVDGFHHPREVRYRRGPDSPEGFFYDSFDLESFTRELLRPLGPGGDRRYRTAVHDVNADQALDAPQQTAAPDAILLVDGIFLLRPALLPYWDFRIFLDAPFEITLQRALVRDRELLGGEDAVRRRYLERYIPGQRIYLETCRPREHADWIIEVGQEGANR